MFVTASHHKRRSKGRRSKGRTELIIGASEAKLHEEIDFDVPDCLAPQIQAKKAKRGSKFR